MLKRLSTVLLCFLAVTLCASAQMKRHGDKTVGAAMPALDKAYLQTIWDGWSTLDPTNVEKFYATGPHTFFDIAPLKYNSWDEYEKGVKAELAGYKIAKFTLNDDVTVHPYGDLAWVTATVAYQMTTKSGKVEMGNFRWTSVFEDQNGKWIMVHEHVSAPLQ